VLKEVINKTLFVLNPEPSRGMMKFVKEHFKDKNYIRGAEIGVAEGYHVYKYLKTIKHIKPLWLVDPYEPYEMDGIKKDFSKCEKEAKKRLDIFPDLVWVKKTSVEASKEFNDEVLHFVYIDANHSYKTTLEDIEVWYPKVEKGGVIGGHDFSGSFPGVAKAVLEFAEKNKLKIHGSGADWWYVK
jgi:predicted small secreted protein